MVKKAYILTALIFILSSCASLYSNKSHYEDIDFYLGSGDSVAALEELQLSKDSHYAKKDRVVYYLEEGMLYHYAGRYSESNESLTSAENAIEQLIVDSVSKGILSGVLNDNALDYPGEDYENIYINIFKALNYLNLNSIDEALIEIRRVNDKLTALETKYRSDINNLSSDEDVTIPDVKYNFYNDALARYLGVIAYRLDGEYDDSRIEQEYLDKSYAKQPQIYNFSKPEYPELDSNRTYINIICHTGLSPEKTAETIYAISGYNGVVLEGNSDNFGFSTIGYNNLSSDFNLKLEFPVLVKRNDPVSYIEVTINGENIGKLNLIEPIENVALETFKVKQPLIVGKTVIRAVSKAIASEITEELVANEFGQGAGLLTSLAGDIYMHVSENSDLRISRYFPANVWGIELEAEPGMYNISLSYYSSNNVKLYQDDFFNVVVKDRALNLIESHLVR